MPEKRSRRGATKSKDYQDSPGEVRGVDLEPIRHVNRELTRPDGSKLVVKVPVYPPFKLRDHGAPQEKRGRKRAQEKKAS